MKKTWIILLTGMLVIGLIPGAMANPKVDSNAQAQNEKQLTVTVDGANAADAAINQILTNNGAQDNHNAGIGGNANAISGNIGTQTTGSDNMVNGCNAGHGTATGTGSGTGAGTGGAANGGFDNLADHGSAAGNGGGAGGSGVGAGTGTGTGVGGSTNGCNSASTSNLDQASSANAEGGAINGDVDQSNTVKQDALAEIDVHQSLTQPVDIREFQVANAHEDTSIDFNIPVFDNMDSMIEIEKENPIVENTDKHQN